MDAMSRNVTFHSVSPRLTTTLPEIYPGVGKVRQRIGGKRPTFFTGLALNEVGKEYYAIAEKLNAPLASQNLKTNLPTELSTE